MTSLQGGGGGGEGGGRGRIKWSHEGFRYFLIKY